MDETFASLAQSNPGPDEFSILLDKFDRACGSKSNANVLNHIQSFEIACGTAYGEYLPACHSHLTDLMTSDPMYLPLVGAVVEAVHNNLHR